MDAREFSFEASVSREKADVVKPEGWRASYNTNRSRSANPTFTSRHQSSQSLKIPDTIDKEWRRLFESSKDKGSAVAKKSHRSSISDSANAFDEEAFRDKVQFVRRKLKLAKANHDVLAAERNFDFLERWQTRIPLALDRLNTLCKSAWLDLTNIYVDHGNYDQLKRHLDKFERVYGLHTSDRVVYTLRHFLAQNLSSMAFNFWNDTEKAGLLDERSYSDMVNWLIDQRSLENEARKILKSAIARAQSDKAQPPEGTPFVLTVHFYNAAIRFYISVNDVTQLKETLDQMIASAPYGLGYLSLAGWLAEINGIIFRAHFRSQFITTSKPKTRKSSDHSTTADASSNELSGENASLDLEKLLEVQKQMFDLVLSAVEGCGFSITGVIRSQVLRFQILQSPDLRCSVETIQGQITDQPTELLEAIIDSLILRHNIEPVLQLLHDPNATLNLDIPISSSIYALISSRISQILNQPALYPALRGSTESAASTLLSLSRALSPTFDNLTPLAVSGAISCPDLLSLALFQAAFIRQTPHSHLAQIPSKLTARIIVSLLDIIIHVRNHGGEVEPLIPALNSTMEWLMSKSSLNIPNDSDWPYGILKRLQSLHLEAESVEFLFYCAQRLDPMPLAGLVQLRMIHLEALGDWNGVHKLWDMVLERRLHQNNYLVNAYSQIISRQKVGMNSKKEAIARLVASALNNEIRATPALSYEFVQYFFFLGKPAFDVPAFWALERWRRHWRVSLTTNIASFLALIITRRGDEFIKTGVSARLHADFDSYIIQNPKQRHRYNPIDPHEVSIFEDTFDRWYHIFLDATPAATRFISPHVHQQYDPNAKSTPDGTTDSTQLL